MKYLTYLKVLFAISVILISCNPQKKISGNYSYTTECLGNEMDGSQTVKAWGNGRNKKEIIEHAYKNAINDVLFNGIYKGKQDCEKRPIVLKANAQRIHEAYFNEFFADGGEYRNYISLNDERIGKKFSRDRKSAQESITYGFVVRVFLADLRQKMIKDGIIN